MLGDSTSHSCTSNSRRCGQWQHIVAVAAAEEAAGAAGALSATEERSMINKSSTSLTSHTGLDTLNTPAATTPLFCGSGTPLPKALLLQLPHSSKQAPEPSVIPPLTLSLSPDGAAAAATLGLLLKPNWCSPTANSVDRPPMSTTKHRQLLPVLSAPVHLLVPLPTRPAVAPLKVN